VQISTAGKSSVPQRRQRGKTKRPSDAAVQNGRIRSEIGKDLRLDAGVVGERSVAIEMVWGDVEQSGGIEGERRNVTVLYIDAADSTATGSRVDPEVLHSIVRECTQRMVDAVHAIEYETPGGRESFLSIDTDNGKLAGFLRLSFPTAEATALTGIDELRGAAIIREVHVYGPVVELGRSGSDKAQHSGLGARLIRAAEDRAREAGYDRLAVISAIGTRRYYLKHGFDRGELYLFKSLKRGES